MSARVRAGDPAIDDMIALARRGSLPDADERRLREVLAGSVEDHELYEAGRAFDAEAPVQADDASRLAALVDAVEQRVQHKRTGRTRRLAYVALAAVLTVGGAVAANSVLREKDPSPTEIPALRETRTAPEDPAPAATPSFPAARPAPSPEPVAPTDPSVAPVAPKPTPRQKPATPAIEAAPVTEPVVETPPAPEPPAPVAEPKLPTAGELFAAANKARVRGDLDETIRLSRELEARFPDAPETATARLSLGMVYLQVGKPEQALAQFRKEPADARTAEALWGEAQALRALSRASEEKTALNALLARYPSSAYAGAARRRLEALR